MPAKILKSDAEWRARLTPMQYNVARRGGTERAFSGEYCMHQAPGVYACVCCGSRLFAAEAKLADGTGWPSFRAALAPEALRLEQDFAWMTASTEARCARCDAHLGHLLGNEPDGPGDPQQESEQPAGPQPEQHFCINSAALRFEPRNG